MEAFVRKILKLPITGHYFEKGGVKHIAGKVEYLVALSSEDVPDERYAIALPTILLQVSRIPLCRQYLIDNFKNIKYQKFQYLLAQETTRHGGYTDEIKDYFIKTKASGEYIGYLCEGLGKYTQDCLEGLRREHKNQKC
ncbi:MAG: hypothetical protein KZQ85_13370 [Candidatus Thiodiazotropha sp. (ex Myrtea sp. 'scaly one' KF741663)]|nr:hypothetical protein [Candidatus Thiodiazotropha sp. (ex Myrtea sp. 'scaly one' KF741663)]